MLKPAERVFLDRYFNTPDKFLFETYEVGTSKSDKKAIEDNGSVKVEFYKEQEQHNYLSWNSGTTNHTIDYNSGTPYYGNTFTTTGMVNATYSSTTTNFIDMEQLNSNTILTSGNSTLLTDSPDPTRQMKSKSSPKKVETGRIGKGAVSKQKFTNVHYDFDYSPFYVVEYKLLPYSTKTQDTTTVNSVRYCTQCGTKLKPTFKFCSQCGNKA